MLGAAHCTISRTAVNTFALVGTNSRISGGTNHAIELIINHPDYVNINLAYAYDVCVLRTVVPFTFSSLVTPVPMASEYIDPGRNLITAGWGLTSFQGQLPERLQFMIQTTITNADCSYRLIGTFFISLMHLNKIYTFIQGTNGESRISPQMVCKLGVPGVGACHGDSGAAVTTTDGYVAGIVSWGIQCAAGYPDVDARVSFFRDWILESIS